MDRIKHILLATDGSDGSLAAAALAGTLARDCNSRVSIIVVHSKSALLLPGITQAVLPKSTPFSPFPVKDAKKYIEAKATENTLHDAELALGSVPGGVENVQLWGHAAVEICDYAGANGVDMIVIGARGTGSFPSLIVGGTAVHVVIHAPCAVTVAR